MTTASRSPEAGSASSPTPHLHVRACAAPMPTVPPSPPSSHTRQHTSHTSHTSHTQVMHEMGEPYKSGVELLSFHTVSKV